MHVAASVRSLKVVGFLLFGLLFFAGCSSKPPISTTLTDLIAESNDYNVDPMVDFHENVSINGLLLQPQVGSHWYTARPGFFDRLWGKQRSSPAFAIGISARLEEPTFCLSGETPEVAITEVNKVKKSIEAIQARTVEATRITVELAAARAALQANTLDTLRDVVGREARKAELDAKVNSLTAEKAEVDKKLNTELETFRTTVASNPGLIVARWTVKNTSGASAKTGIFDTSASSSDTTSGYVILGGVRVSSLYFGDDLRTYVRTALKEDAVFFDKLGITTYMIQTKALAYTNALDLQRALAGSLTVKVSSLSHIKDLLTDMDKVTIAGYAATAMNLDNTGSLSGVQWYVRSRPMVEYVGPVSFSEAGLKDPGPNMNWYQVKPRGTFQLRDVPPSALGSPSGVPATQALVDEDWYTVVAVTAEAPKVYDAFRKAAKTRDQPIENRFGRSYIKLDPQGYTSRTGSVKATTTPSVR